MLLISGLGNPGKKYLNNRHNAGFILVDKIAEDFQKEFKKKFKGQISEVNILNKKIIISKPDTFMNLSGQSIAEIKKFYKIQNQNIFIVHDDLDLEIGKVKVKNGGSNSGHNGLDSVSECIGNDYNRIRIGISHPGNKNLVESYVLHDFSVEEFKIIKKSNERIKENINYLLNNNFDEFSSRVNNFLWALNVELLGSPM